MTDKELADLPDDRFDEQLDGLSESEIDSLTQTMLVRGFLGEQFLSQFERRLTDAELMTPPFFEKAKSNYRTATRVATRIWSDQTFRARFHRLGGKKLTKRWQELEELIGNDIWRVAGQLLCAKETFERLRLEEDLLKDEHARQSAVLLRTRIRDGKCGASRHTLLAELQRFTQDAGAEPVGLRSILPKQRRESALRTFVIRYLATELAKHGSRPKLYLILDLTEATLPEESNVITVEHVRTALGI
jgi:hypothetical protein